VSIAAPHPSHSRSHDHDVPSARARDAHPTRRTSNATHIPPLPAPRDASRAPDATPRAVGTSRAKRRGRPRVCPTDHDHMSDRPRPHVRPMRAARTVDVDASTHARSLSRTDTITTRAATHAHHTRWGRRGRVDGHRTADVALPGGTIECAFVVGGGDRRITTRERGGVRAPGVRSSVPLSRGWG